MRLIDKICAWVSIPVGALVFLFGFISVFTGFGFRFDLGLIDTWMGFSPPPPGGLILLIFGWTMCFTTSHMWRSSLKRERDLFLEKHQDEFKNFLKAKPIFIEAGIKLQYREFRSWLEDQ